MLQIINKHLPNTLRPNGSVWPRPGFLGDQLLGRARFEVSRNSFDFAFMPFHNKVNMLIQDCASKDSITALLNRPLESSANCQLLRLSPNHRWKLERLLGGLASPFIVRLSGHGSPCFHLRRGPISEKVPASHKFRPRPAWIVGQPKPVRGEDRVLGNDHGRLPV